MKIKAEWENVSDGFTECYELVVGDQCYGSVWRQTNAKGDKAYRWSGSNGEQQGSEPDLGKAKFKVETFLLKEVSRLLKAVEL